MNPSIDAFRISPTYSSTRWNELSKDDPNDWPAAVDIVRDRLEGRFLRFADSWIDDPFSGFVVLAVDCLLVETIQQFRTGDITGKSAAGKSRAREHFLAFLSGSHFQPDFTEAARTRFYEDIRCGLLHQAEAKKMWLVRRGLKSMLEPISNGKGYAIDVRRFHKAMRLTLDDYYKQILDQGHEQIRTNLWIKMAAICQTRTARGLLYEEASGAEMLKEST